MEMETSQIMPRIGLADAFHDPAIGPTDGLAGRQKWPDAGFGLLSGNLTSLAARVREADQATL